MPCLALQMRRSINVKLAVCPCACLHERSGLNEFKLAYEYMDMNAAEAFSFAAYLLNYSK